MAMVQSVDIKGCREVVRNSCYYPSCNVFQALEALPDWVVDTCCPNCMAGESKADHVMEKLAEYCFDKRAYSYVQIVVLEIDYLELNDILHCSDCRTAHQVVQEVQRQQEIVVQNQQEIVVQLENQHCPVKMSDLLHYLLGEY